VSGAGDVNLDGLADLIVGAPFGGDQSGRSFVVFGKADHTPGDLGDVLAGSGGFAINGAQAEDWAGWPVSRAGDVNGDGAADVVVAAKLADPDGRDQAGASYVVFGKADPAPIDLGDVEAGVGGFAIHGIDPHDGAGEAISGGGDINGDGLADLIVGAPNADPNDTRNAGESYVVFGKADGAPVELSAVAAGSGGFVIDGSDIDDLSGLAVAVADDVNGDGLDDLLVGAASADVRPPSELSSGEAYVVYGKADGMPVNLSDVGAGVGGFVLVGEHGFDSLGRAVSGAGDVDGDGFADLVVDAPGAAETYVVFGGDFTGAVDRLGTAGDDTLSGTSADEVLMGAEGDDLLIGNGGLDVLNGGAGDDVLALIDPSLMEGTGGGRLLGGSGIDTIRLEGSSAALDLTAIPDTRIGGIETVDLGGGGNGLALDLGEVLHLSDTSNTLTVLGESGDRVGGALPGASVDTNSNPGFTTFAVGQAQLLVQTGIDTAGIDTTAA
jgi:FG-GAP repeat/RTX calcium-binding nonapeptide repeat (4 copies)